MPEMWNKNSWCLAITLLLAICFCNAARFNEVLYDPLGKDDCWEFVEIFSDNENISLENWTISDGNENDTLIKINNITSNYILILEKDTCWNFSDVAVYTVDDYAIGNSLTKGEELILYDNLGNIVDNITLLAVSSGHSIEFQNNEWKQSSCINGTPGKENSRTPEFKDYKLKITEIYPNCFENEKEWIEIKNTGKEKINLEGLEIRDAKNNSVTLTTTNTFPLILKTKDYAVVKFPRNILNNRGFEKIYLFAHKNLIDEVSYSYTEKGFSWSLIEKQWYLTDPTPGEENKIENSIEKNSSLAIISFPNETEFGKIIKVKVNTYKGDTRKYAIYLYIKNKTLASEKTTFYIKEKYKNITLTLPVAIKDNCANKRLKQGYYELVLEGLGLKTKKHIFLKEKFCKETKNKAKNTKINTTENNLKAKNPNITISYKSPEAKAKDLALYLLLAITAVLIIKKWK